MSKNIRLKSLLKENTDMLDKGKEYMFVEYHGKSLFPAAIIPVRYDGIDSRLKRHMFYPVEDKYKNKFPMGIAIPDTGGPVLNKKFKKDNNISWKITDRMQQEAEQKQLEEDSGFNYLKHEIENFISKSDQNSPYKPQIKLYWGGDMEHLPSSVNAEASTKWLSVSWDSIAKIAELLSRNK